jgi:hypothetical protein
LDGLLDQVGGAIGGVLDSAPVRLLVSGMVGYATVVWLAVAHWVYRDMRRRRPDPFTPYVAAIVVVLATPVLLPVAVFTYLILRPGETLAESRERELSERLDALDAERDMACPGCAMRVEEDWLVCPDCRTRLAHTCRTCGGTMGLDWTLCGWCGAEFGQKVHPQRLPAAVRAASVDSLPRGEPRGGLLEPGG